MMRYMLRIAVWASRLPRTSLTMRSAVLMVMFSLTSSLVKYNWYVPQCDHVDQPPMMLKNWSMRSQEAWHESFLFATLSSVIHTTDNSLTTQRALHRGRRESDLATFELGRDLCRDLAPSPTALCDEIVSTPGCPVRRLMSLKRVCVKRPSTILLTFPSPPQFNLRCRTCLAVLRNM